MKTKLLTALIGAAFAAPAFAQSSVTMYGIVDAGIHIGSGGTKKLVSGIADGSRLGFKGMEDLGGGYKAIFTLEARVELDTGGNTAGNISGQNGLALTRGLDAALAAVPFPATLASAAAAIRTQGVVPAVISATNPATVVNSSPLGAPFDRTSMVGLITPFGAIMAGRMYTPGYEILAAADTFETGTAGGWGTIAGGAAGLLSAGVSIRSNEAVQYRIQTPNGFSAALMYGFRGSGYVGSDRKFRAANVKYTANGWNVGIGYNNGDDQNGRPGLITWTIGGSYTTGPMKFFAGYHDMKNENSVLIKNFTDAWDLQIAPGLATAFAARGVPAVAYTPILAAYRAPVLNTISTNLFLDATSWTLGMHYRMGSGRIMTSVNQVNDKTGFDADATQFSVGYDYDLSKRTDIYSIVSVISNKNTAQYTPGAASAPGGFTSGQGDTARAFQIGIRHRF